MPLNLVGADAIWEQATIGDVATLRFNGNDLWRIGHDHYVGDAHCSTQIRLDGVDPTVPEAMEGEAMVLF